MPPCIRWQAGFRNRTFLHFFSNPLQVTNLKLLLLLLESGAFYMPTNVILPLPTLRRLFFAGFNSIQIRLIGVVDLRMPAAC